MLPVAIIAYRYKMKWGLLAGFVYGLIQMILGANNLSYGTSALAVVAIILFDYLVAFGVIGFAGMFRDKLKGNQPLEVGLGVLVICVLRFICHFISGWTVWGAWADSYDWSKGMPAWLYSLIYNGTYMVFETIITVVVAVIICAVLDFRKDTISPIKKKTH
jgi:thiamine transporter